MPGDQLLTKASQAACEGLCLAARNQTFRASAKGQKQPQTRDCSRLIIDRRPTRAPNSHRPANERSNSPHAPATPSPRAPQARPRAIPAWGRSRCGGSPARQTSGPMPLPTCWSRQAGRRRGSGAIPVGPGTEPGGARLADGPRGHRGPAPDGSGPHRATVTGRSCRPGAGSSPARNISRRPRIFRCPIRG